MSKERFIKLRPNSKLPDGGWKRQALSRAQAEAAGGNIGLKTGRGLLVVDLDCKNGHDGMAQWQDLCRQHGFEPPAPLVRTPSGGWHIYFSAPRSRRLVGRVGILPGVDLRGDGNYVLVPPSRTEAGEYRYVDPGRREAGPHPPAPAWLLEMARPGRKKGPKGPGKGAALDLPAEVEPASPEEVEAALQALERRWPAMPWRAIWAGEEMTQDRNGATRTPSQRDQMLAYRLAAVGYSPEAIVRLMTACPAVRARRKGKQPDAWRRASYREATIQAAVDLVQQHRAGRAAAPAGQDGADDAIGQALAVLRQTPGWEVWAAQAMIVRSALARTGDRAVRLTARIWTDRLLEAGVEITEWTLRKRWDPRRNQLLGAAEDAAGHWWFRLTEDEITRAADEARTMSSPAPAGSASGRSAGRAEEDARKSGSHTPTCIRYRESAQNGDRSPGRTCRKGRKKTTVIAQVEVLLRQGKQPAEVAQILGISRAAAKNYAYRLRQRQAEAAAEAPRPEPAAEAAESVDVAWSLTPGRRILYPWIPAEALRQQRRHDARLRAADRVDAYARAVCAPDGWDARIAPVMWHTMAPQEAAQAVIRAIGNWLRYTPPAEWLPDHQQAIRDWIAGEERRHQALLDRMARKSGARRYHVHLSEALLIEKALEALDLRHMWLPDFWISRRDHRKTADDFQAFREDWAMARYLSAYELDPPAQEDLEVPVENQQQPEAPLEFSMPEMSECGRPQRFYEDPQDGGLLAGFLRRRRTGGDGHIFACPATFHLLS